MFNTAIDWQLNGHLWRIGWWEKETELLCNLIDLEKNEGKLYRKRKALGEL